MLPEGGEPELVMGTPFDERHPRFSPDGQWLAYMSNRSGNDEIYVRPYPGPGPEVTVSVGGGVDPVWSPDGSELFYRSGEQMMAVPIDVADGFRPGTPVPLFQDFFWRDINQSDYDVAPDGQHFVMLRAGGEGGSTSVTLVRNWFTELGERMAED